MDLIKIGKFISSLRKDKNLTQEQLAEKLYVTDRAVSKWERGLSLPDAGKMIDLCSILSISVNELLNGEKIDMKDYKDKSDELLLELIKQEEVKNKKLIFSMWFMVITNVIFYLALLGISVYVFEEGFILGVIIVLSTLLFVIVASYALKLEVDAGYYECKNCHHRFIPTYFKTMIAPHMSTTRYLKCPKCNKKSWSKKVLTRK